MWTKTPLIIWCHTSASWQLWVFGMPLVWISGTLQYHPGMSDEIERNKCRGFISNLYIVTLTTVHWNQKIHYWSEIEFQTYGDSTLRDCAPPVSKLENRHFKLAWYHLKWILDRLTYWYPLAWKKKQGSSVVFLAANATQIPAIVFDEFVMSPSEFWSRSISKRAG